MVEVCLCSTVEVNVPGFKDGERERVRMKSYLTMRKYSSPELGSMLSIVVGGACAVS